MKVLVCVRHSINTNVLYNVKSNKSGKKEANIQEKERSIEQVPKDGMRK
jgi:hypothetical protein